MQKAHHVRNWLSKGSSYLYPSKWLHGTLSVEMCPMKLQVQSGVLLQKYINWRQYHVVLKPYISYAPGSWPRLRRALLQRDSRRGGSEAYRVWWRGEVTSSHQAHACRASRRAQITCPRLNTTFTVAIPVELDAQEYTVNIHKSMLVDTWGEQGWEELRIPDSGCGPYNLSSLWLLGLSNIQW